MPAPLLPQLDAAIETAVFRALVLVIQSDPTLANVVRSWEVLDGTSKTLNPPSTSMMPWVRLMPGPSDMFQAEAAAWEVDFTIYATLATAGLHVDDQTNLWGAFRAALNYEKPFQKTDVANYLRGAGCVLHQISSPGFGPYPPPSHDQPSPAQDLYGTARVVLKLLIPF